MISVIICTYNRSHYLREALRGLERQKTGAAFEIIVVNNNSTDNTAEVVAQWSKESRYHTEYVEEGNQGLSHARNRGVQVAKGDILAFLDDDAVAEPQWIESIAEVMRDMKSCVIVGGPVILDWQGCARPPWLSDLFTPSLSAYERPKHQPAVVESEQDFVLGGNMAIRASLLRELGGFNPALGRRGDVLAEGEEMALQVAVFQKKGDIVYHPSMKILHVVIPERLTKSYFKKFYQGKARTSAHEFLSRHPSKIRGLIHFCPRIILWMLRSLSAIGKSDLRFYAWLQVVHHAEVVRHFLTK